MKLCRSMARWFCQLVRRWEPSSPPVQPAISSCKKRGLLDLFTVPSFERESAMCDDGHGSIAKGSHNEEKEGQGGISRYAENSPAPRTAFTY